MWLHQASTQFKREIMTAVDDEISRHKETISDLKTEVRELRRRIRCEYYDLEVLQRKKMKDNFLK